MSPAERSMLRTLIDRARRAQVDRAGGYVTLEKNARGHDLTLDRLMAKRQGWKARAREMREAGCSYQQIMAGLDVSYWQIHYALHDEADRQLRRLAA